MLSLGAAGVHAEGQQADSDDYNCNHGAPDDPTTIEACGHLRGTSVGAGAQDIGHQRNSDDWNCNHGDPNSPVTLAACQRLRGSTYEVGRDEGHLRNSDDWNCHHAAPGSPTRIAACARLRGEYPGGPGARPLCQGTCGQRPGFAAPHRRPALPLGALHGRIQLRRRNPAAGGVRLLRRAGRDWATGGGGPGRRSLAPGAPRGDALRLRFTPQPPRPIPSAPARRAGWRGCRSGGPSPRR